MQQFADAAYEGSLPNQSFKSEDCILRTEIGHRSDDWLDPVMAHDRHQIANLRICGTRIAQEFRNVDRLESIRFQIDEIDALGRVPEHFVSGDIDTQTRLARSD